jgi:hypothetical protein
MRSKSEAASRRGGERRGCRNGSARSGGRGTAETASRRTRARGVTATAPARETRAPKSGPQTSAIARPVERSARPKSSSQARARAKARKAKAPRVIRPRLTERLAARLSSIDLRPRTIASKVPFVVLVIGALGLGLGLTLWLSTDSAERSYHLSDARERTRMLQQQKESLERDVREAESAPALAEAARKLGMIPTRDTAHLVQDPGGAWVVVGTPKPADGVPPPPLNSRLPEPGAPRPQTQPALPPEVAVRVTPGPAVPPVSGPEALLRAPDGSTTVGGQHLPQAAPQLPGVPGGQDPGLTPLPGLPAPGGTEHLQGPIEVPAPLGGQALPMPGPAAAPAPVPTPGLAEAPAPLHAGTTPGAAPAPQAPAPVLAAPAPPVNAHAQQPAAPVIAPAPQAAPGNGEQFGPVTSTAPGAAR